MANNTSIQEQLTYKAISQIGLIIISVLVCFFYIKEKVITANTNVETTNAAISNYTATQKIGISFAQLQTLVTKTNKDSSISEIIATQSGSVKEVIAIKDSNMNYVDWLNKSLITSDSEKETIQTERAKINAIIPTISPFYESISEDNVGLGDYIAFVEQNILKRFNITSYSSLGIAGIQYVKDENTTNPIGRFQIELNFSNSSVGDILKLLDYVHNSGDYDKIENSPSKNTVMKDPLMTVESFSITESADSRFIDSTVSGRVVLNFYIRGSSENDKKFLVEALNKQKKELENKISYRLEECKRISCPAEEVAKIEQFQKKFNEFTKSLSQSISSKNGNTTEVIYIISQQLQSISSLDDEFSKIK